MKREKYLIVFPFSCRNRTAYLLERFFRETTDFSSVLHLTSRWSKIEDFRTQLYLYKKRPLIPPASFSLKSFASRIVNEYTDYRLISTVEQFLLLLEFCLPVAEKRGITPVSFAIKLKTFIKDFKVSHEKLEFKSLLDIINNYQWRYEENKNLIIQAFEIMEKYQQFLKHNRLIDEDDVYQIASQYVEKIKLNTVLLEGILEFIPSQRQFIASIARNAQKFICVYQFDEDVPLDAKNLILKPNIEFLKTITDEIIVVNKIKDSCEDCVVYNFPSPEEEIKGIAKMIIKEMAENKDANWEDFLVVFPQMLFYRELVERIFRRMKIPFCMTPGYVLSQDPSIVAIISFLNWLDTPMWWEGLMSLFTSPFFSFDFDEAIEFSKKTRLNFKGFGFFPDEKWLKGWKNWNRIERAMKIMGVKQDSLIGWINRLINALNEMGWKEFDTEGKLAFMEVLEELKSNIRTDRNSFIIILKGALNLTEVEKSKGYGVKVMGVLDSTGLETEFMFMGGTTDDALPETRTEDEFFLPDRLKESLGLATYDMKLARERLDIYRLKQSHRRSIFSYPSRASGRQMGKSIMLYGLKELTTGEASYFSGLDTIFSIKPDMEKFRKKFLKDGILYFNVTQLDKMARCPYEFYLNCVEGIEPYKIPEIEEIPEFWGILLHRAAEKAAADFKGKIMDEYCIHQQYEKFCHYVNLFLEEPSLVSEKYPYKIPPVIKTFLEKRKKSVFESFKNALERHTGHKIIDIEEKQSIRVGNMMITGKFDRIEETRDGIYEIIDFKSGKAPDLNKKYPATGNCLDLKNLELPLYCLILYKLSGRKSNVFVWSLNFDQGIFELRYPQIAGFLEIFEEEIKILSQRLLEGNFNFSAKGKNCFGCAFSNYCIIRSEDEE
ncbi:MAG: PD-(D/E)XK nuclease family protein [bacterium]|nr:PD-(D/E)XK nuclease family protein [bacterium]